MLKNSIKAVKKISPFFSLCLFFIYLINHNQNFQNTQKSLNFTFYSNDYQIEKIIDSPLIFIGGFARSGTTLMRALLDVHQSVSCGPETKILPFLLNFLLSYTASTKNMEDIKQARFKNSTIDSATALFVYHILKEHIKNAERLCAKDPDILNYIEYLHRLFPKAKFIYMIRDPRAAVCSLMTRVNETLNDQRVNLYFSSWFSYQLNVKMQCSKVGSMYCKIIKYEDLVLKPEKVTKDIAEFLNITWTKNFLEHDKYVGSKIVVSNTEWSTDQIKKPIYIDSLNSWRGKIRYDKRYLEQYSYLLNEFGYNLD